MEKPYQYGEVILESKSKTEIMNKLTELKEKHGYKVGDLPAESLNLDKYTYVLILNSDDYVDVEYKVPIVDYKIINYEELRMLKESGIY